MSYILILLTHTWKNIKIYHYLTQHLEKDIVHVYYIPWKQDLALQR